MPVLGNRSEGENFDSCSNRIVGSKFLTGQDGIVDSIYAYIKAENINICFKCALYRYEDMALLGVTEERSGISSEPAWIQFTFPEPKPQIENDKYYVLVVWCNRVNNSEGYVAYSEDEDGLYAVYDYNDFPDPLGAVTELTDRVYSIYASYTAVPPSEYGATINSLKSFRNNVLNDMVVQRIKARLEAMHETMQKYVTILDTINITPYLFGRIRDKVLALQFKGMDIGGGKQFKLTQNYTGGLSEYPKGVSPPVTPRLLPQVDEYIFDVISDLDLLKETDVSKLQTFVIIQCDSDMFMESPDAENYLYDYYSMYPNNKWITEYDIVNPISELSDWEKIKGERVWFVRELTSRADGNHYLYILDLFINPVITGAEMIKTSSPLLAWVSSNPSPAPDVTFSVAGQRIPLSIGGVWGNVSPVEATPAPQFYVTVVVGWMPICDSLSPVSQTKVWDNVFNVTVEVNDPNKGTTDPPPDTYNAVAAESFTVTAVPNAGYTFDHWEVDGVTWSTDLTLNKPIYKPTTIKAVFM